MAAVAVACCGVRVNSKGLGREDNEKKRGAATGEGGERGVAPVKGERTSSGEHAKETALRMDDRPQDFSAEGRHFLFSCFWVAKVATGESVIGVGNGRGNAEAPRDVAVAVLAVYAAGVFGGCVRGVTDVPY